MNRAALPFFVLAEVSPPLSPPSYILIHDEGRTYLRQVGHVGKIHLGLACDFVTGVCAGK